jgi:hypothetical protein
MSSLVLEQENAVLAFDAQDECFKYILEFFKELIAAGIVGVAHANCLAFDEPKFVSDSKAFAAANVGKKLFAVFHDTIGGVPDHIQRDEADVMNLHMVNILEGLGYQVKVV